MDFRQLRTFTCVAELGSLSKASDTLRIAQPALSRQIKLLEHELRTELFTRNGRGMVLTDAGRLLLARTSGIVREIDQIRDDIQSAQGPPSGRVVLGLVPTVSCVLSARFARRCVEKFPGISLRIVESYSGHLIEWLHRGEMDLSIIYGRTTDLHLAAQPLGRDQIIAVGPRGCGLSRKKQVEIGWLLRQRLVLPSHSHGLRALIEHAAALKKIKLDVQLEADSFRVLTSLVEEGLGFAGNRGDREAAVARADHCLSDRPPGLDRDRRRHRAVARGGRRLPQGRPLGYQAGVRRLRCAPTAEDLREARPVFPSHLAHPVMPGFYSGRAATVSDPHGEELA
jgi:LysR family transcriptional regulator, nitrogen assimilation regulatory protein